MKTLIIFILFSFLSGQDRLVLKNNRVYNGKITGDKLTMIEFKPKGDSYLSIQTNKIRILKSNDKVIIISGMRIKDYLKLDLSSKCKIDASYGHKKLDTDLSNILPANERLAYPAFFRKETKEYKRGNFFKFVGFSVCAGACVSVLIVFAAMSGSLGPLWPG